MILPLDGKKQRFPEKILWMRRIAFFLLKSRRFSKLNIRLRFILFAKKHVDMYILVPTALPKSFCSNSVKFFWNFEKIPDFSPITVEIFSFPEWSLYLELFIRAHRIHVSNPCCKKRHGKILVTFKLAVLWDFFSTPRCRNHLQFAQIQNEWPDVPQNFIILPSDSFLIRTAAEEDLKLSWILVFQKISLTFFFFLLSPAFSIDFNCYEQLLEKTNSFVFWFYLRWRNFCKVSPRSNKKIGFFFKLLSQMVVSLPDVTQT